MILDNQLNYNIQPDTSFNKIFLDVLVCCLKTGTLWNHHSRPLLEEYLQINLTLFSRPILIQKGLIQGQFLSPGIYSYSWVHFMVSLFLQVYIYSYRRVQFMVSLFLQVYIYSYRRVQFKVSSFLQVYTHTAGFYSRQFISPGIYSYSWVQFKVSLFLQVYIYSYRRVQFKVSSFLQVYIYSYRRVQYKVSSFLQVYTHIAGFNSRLVIPRYILIYMGSIQGQFISPGIYSYRRV